MLTMWWRVDIRSHIIATRYQRRSRGCVCFLIVAPYSKPYRHFLNSIEHVIFYKQRRMAKREMFCCRRVKAGNVRKRQAASESFGERWANQRRQASPGGSRSIIWFFVWSEERPILMIWMIVIMPRYSQWLRSFTDLIFQTLLHTHSPIQQHVWGTIENAGRQVLKNSNLNIDSAHRFLEIDHGMVNEK